MMRIEAGKHRDTAAAYSAAVSRKRTLAEEHPILLVSKYRNQISRGVGSFGFECKALLLGRPLNCGVRGKECSLELLRRIVDLRWVVRLPGVDAIPLDIERHLGTNGEHRRKTRNSQPLSQRVGNIVVIEDIQTTNA